ncbi:hypothetical protein [Bacillus sp. C1]
MKATKLISLAIPFMLLTGCGTDSAEKKADTKVEVKAEEKKTDSLQVSEEKKSDSSNVAKAKSQDDAKVKAEKEYKSKLNSLMGDFTKQIQELNDIVASDKSVIDKGTEFNEKKDAFTKTTEKIITLDPGDKYKDVHSILQDAMYSAKTGALTVDGGLILKDENLVHQGGESMTKASKLLLEVDKKLKETK